MFNNLPGKVTQVSDSDACDFYNAEYIDSLKEIVESDKASEALKERYNKGVGWVCHEHATVRIQGETDSFGCEYTYLCKSCHEIVKEIDEYTTDKHSEDLQECDWCKKETKLKFIRPTRDIDEGSNGPVYDVCGSCREAQNKRIDEDLDYLDQRGS